MADLDPRTGVVLLVEDDDADALLIQEALDSNGAAHTVAHVTDGVAALEYLRDPAASRPDLIVLDWNMPRMGGREFLEEVKTDPALLTIPVVVLTTSQAPADVADSYRRHANAYLTKPLVLDDFLAVVTRLDDFFLGTVVTAPRPDPNASRQPRS
ncbi:response regulator [Streptacidiphilus sp. PAMC 29251]